MSTNAVLCLLFGFANTNCLKQGVGGVFCCRSPDHAVQTHCRGRVSISHCRCCTPRVRGRGHALSSTRIRWGGCESSYRSCIPVFLSSPPCHGSIICIVVCANRDGYILFYPPICHIIQYAPYSRPVLPSDACCVSNIIICFGAPLNTMHPIYPYNHDVFQ